MGSEMCIRDSKDIENGNTTGSDEEEKRDGIKDSDDEDDDDEAGLSDEGLGDITSEASNSPQPPQISSQHQNSALNKNTYVVKSSEDCDNNPVDMHVTQPRNIIINKSEVFSVKSEVIKNTSTTTTSSSLPTSPCDERVPSRIAFPKPRNSQTHL